MLRQLVSGDPSQISALEALNGCEGRYARLGGCGRCELRKEDIATTERGPR
jgi:hypothetical protein